MQLVFGKYKTYYTSHDKCFNCTRRGVRNNKIALRFCWIEFHEEILHQKVIGNDSLLEPTESVQSSVMRCEYYILNKQIVSGDEVNLTSTPSSVGYFF